MPIYCYKCTECGKTEEEFFPIDDRKLVIDCPDCGAPAERDLVSERPGRLGSTEAIWPCPCDALGVNPDQCKEAHNDSVRQGVPTDFNSDGNPVFTSLSHKRRYAKTQGYQMDG